MTWLLLGAVALFFIASARANPSASSDSPEAALTRTGYVNGVPFTLTVAPIGGGKYLSVAAAAAYLRMAAAYTAETGRVFVINSAFRTMAEQQYEYDTQGPTIAAVPGKSTHQQGRSLDISTGGLSYASPEYIWLAANARNYGFRNDAPREAWHWTYEQ